MQVGGTMCPPPPLVGIREVRTINDRNICERRGCMKEDAQWPIRYGVGLRIKRSAVRIRPWPLRSVLGQGSLLPLSQGEAFTLASISYPAILVKYILAKKMKNNGKSPTFKFVSGEERRPSEVQRVSRGWRLPGATHSSADLTWIRK